MAEQSGKRRWVPILLGISLALNLAVVAALAGAVWRHNVADRGGPRAAKGGAIYMQALPREIRRAVRAQMRGGAHPEARTGEMLTALRSDPFDPAAAIRVLDSERDAGLARQSAASAAWLAQVSAMSTQERGAYADRLEDLLERRHKHAKSKSGG